MPEGGPVSEQSLVLVYMGVTWSSGGGTMGLMWGNPPLLLFSGGDPHTHACSIWIHTRHSCLSVCCKAVPCVSVSALLLCLRTLLDGGLEPQYAPAVLGEYLAGVEKKNPPPRAA